MDLLLIVVLVGLLVLMFVSSRRRTKKMKEQQEQRQLQMLPGARVMTRSGLFGTIVSFDPDDLTQPAEVEIAPGVVIEVHAQAIDLAPEREPVVEDEVVVEEEIIAEEPLLDERPLDDRIADERPLDDRPVAGDPVIELPEPQERADRADDVDGLPGDDKPKN